LGEPVPTEYEIVVDEPLVHGNRSKDVGRIRARFVVSTSGGALSSALDSARHDGCGTATKSLAHRLSIASKWLWLRW
jgi:hypothetical protein